MHDRLRQLPSVQALLEGDDIQGVIAQFGRAAITDALREILDEARQAIRGGGEIDLPNLDAGSLAEAVQARLEAQSAPNLRSVINATGILLHTNLGRASLAPEAIAAMSEIGGKPSNLEYDLVSGTRGSRHRHVEDLICRLTGAEAAMVVNNCAAAVLLSLLGAASGWQVVASRGELIEIGGSYRLPDVIEQSGALLKEVGTTNRTRLSDYAAAIGENTAVLLKSHTSNFRITGFTESPDRADLSALAREKGVWLFEDLGSGVLVDLAPYGLPDEPQVAQVLASGVDLVMFSGDKLLGGPQAGILAGRAEIVEKLKANPVARAVRLDKLSLAALEATLRLYLPPHDPFRSIPLLRKLAEPVEEVRLRAVRFLSLLGAAGENFDAELVTSRAEAGGGSLPGQEIDSFAIALRNKERSPDRLAHRLREGSRPVVGRIARDRLLLDMRTVEEEELEVLAEAVKGLAE